jgi:hypothetical protein
MPPRRYWLSRIRRPATPHWSMPASPKGSSSTDPGSMIWRFGPPDSFARGPMGRRPGARSGPRTGRHRRPAGRPHHRVLAPFFHHAPDRRRRRLGDRSVGASLPLHPTRRHVAVDGRCRGRYLSQGRRGLAPSGDGPHHLLRVTCGRGLAPHPGLNSPTPGEPRAGGPSGVEFGLGVMGRGQAGGPIARMTDEVWDVPAWSDHCRWMTSPG